MLDAFSKSYSKKTAIISGGNQYSYQDLQAESQKFASFLLDNEADLHETRVAFMITPGFDYVKTQWAIWQAGGIAVPLCTTHPLSSLQYTIEDSQAEIIIVSPEFESIFKEYIIGKNLKFIVINKDNYLITSNLLKIKPTRRAMILYTSGTTNLPKGVVTSHANIQAQVSSLLKAWEYSEDDNLLCILPLHHIHGIINVVSCTLFVGGTVEFMNFSAEGVFSWMKRIAQAKKQGVFMAVPTIYFKLITYFENLAEAEKVELTNCMKHFRLMISGSAALPVSVMEKWEKISGHRLLERYGMTEIGMAISNPYHNERRAGHIGQPLPNIEVKLVDETGLEVRAGDAGEILVKGPNVFEEYWQKPQATQEAFTVDGWFKTGDVAVLEGGYYKILGRSSIDIIKSGGYKISALEIEEVLRTHPQICDCSVVGIDNEEWGELVSAVLVLEDKNMIINDLNLWIREKMPAYKVPRQYKVVDELPRNAMGKVTKNDLKKLF
jgi:malonyl-CoA/methylmalonyl-CoA synthetase